MRHQPIKPMSATAARLAHAYSVTTYVIIKARRVSVFDLVDLNLAAGTANLPRDGKLYEAECIGRFWYLNGNYTEL